MSGSNEKSLMGSWGERMAAEYLRKKRYRLLAVNFRCRGGEIDLIASHGKYIAFVEVKMRRDDRHGEAREFVTKTKQSRVIRAAKYWLVNNPTSLQPRFDVIEVYAPDGMDTIHPAINHIEDAFEL